MEPVRHEEGEVEAGCGFGVRIGEGLDDRATLVRISAASRTARRSAGDAGQ